MVANLEALKVHERSIERLLAEMESMASQPPSEKAPVYYSML